MSIQSQDGKIIKNLKEKVQSITYSPLSLGNSWITINGKKYAVWLDDDMEIFPGSIIEHSPFINKQYKGQALLATTIIKK